MSRREALHDWEETPPEKHLWLVDWKKYGKPFCSLYVIAPEGHWPSKIGISTRPEKRVQSLQTAHWKTLAVAQCFQCVGVKEARALEEKVHSVFREDGAYLMGEWFDKTASETVDVIKFSAAVIGVEITDTVVDPEIIKDLKRRVYNEGVTYMAARTQGGSWFETNSPIMNPVTGKEIR